MAFGLSRLRWPGRDLLFTPLATMMLPGVVMMIPVFIIFKKIVGSALLSTLVGGLVWRGHFSHAPIYDDLADRIWMKRLKIDGVLNLRILCK